MKIEDDFKGFVVGLSLMEYAKSCLFYFIPLCTRQQFLTIIDVKHTINKPSFVLSIAMNPN